MSPSQYAEPVKRINTEFDLQKFKQSIAYKRLHLVIAFVVETVKNCEVPEGSLSPLIVTRDATSELDTLVKAAFEASKLKFSKAGNDLLDIFQSLNDIVDETPPLEGPRRFGNMACRDWHKKMKVQAQTLLSRLIHDQGARSELAYYLTNSFGSELRLDYGSGHELSFLAFIGGLLQAGILSTDVSGGEILALFSRYYDLARRLILVYNLEPAGSHGVWGLDDHFHFIYILGAAEYTTAQDETAAAYVPPVRQMLSPEVVKAHELSNLYVNAISFIFRLKLGPFNEHSPILYDVHRSVSLWGKVQSGLLKMYEVEVLGKFPVVQHFWFGGAFFPWTDANTQKELTSTAEATDSKQDDRELPGLINNYQGTNTTRSNIAITRAPWANANSFRAPTSSVPRDNARSSLFHAKQNDVNASPP